jgi:hypothetical protein
LVERIRRTTGGGSWRTAASESAARDSRERDHIRRLQQSAGNQAVTGLLARRAAQRAVLQRYETREHTLFGADGITMTVAGETMTQGEMIAMADFFADVEQMEDHPRQVADVLRAIRTGTAGTAEWQEATGGRYLELALDNESHFGPPDARLVPQPGGGATDHYERFAEGHLRALWESATGGSRVAQVHNSFAAHFLTDAFAAGHVINKADLMHHFQTRLTDRDAFLGAIAARAWRDDHVREVMSARETAGGFHLNFDSALMFRQFLSGVDAQRPEVIRNSVALAVHDALNHLVDDPLLGGLEVTNDRGDTWRLAGDDTLANSPDSLRIGRAAVAQANANLVEVEGVGAPAMTAAYREELLARVWAFVPRPTHVGELQVGEIVERMTAETDPQLLDTLGAQVAANIDAIAEAAERAGAIRVEPIP